MARYLPGGAVDACFLLDKLRYLYVTSKVASVSRMKVFEGVHGKGEEPNVKSGSASTV